MESTVDLSNRLHARLIVFGEYLKRPCQKYEDDATITNGRFGELRCSTLLTLTGSFGPGMSRTAALTLDFANSASCA